MTNASSTGVDLLRRQEDARVDFVASLQAAEAEAEHEGWHSLDDALVEADQIIAAKRDAA